MRGGAKHLEVIVRALSKRKELGITPNDFVIISVGELNPNKNHEVIIEAIARLKNPHIKYILCGQGELTEYLSQKAEQYGLQSQVKILGYRTDIKELLEMSDLFAFPSKREGLGIAALEAMAAGLPLLTSNIHGINDYSIQGVTGYKEGSDDVIGYAKDIEKCINDVFSLYKMQKGNTDAVTLFDQKQIDSIMQAIYSETVAEKCVEAAC